jgi:hypothetical protein
MNADKHRSEFRSVFIRVHLWLNFRWAWLWSDNSEFAHAVIERRAVYSQACCGSGWATNHPLRVTENFQDVIALDIF